MKAFEDASFDAVIDKGVLTTCLNIIISLDALCFMYITFWIFFLYVCVCVFRNLRLYFGE